MAEVVELAEMLAGLGVRRGGVLLVHSSLRGSGLWAEDVRDTLLGALGSQGTLVVPAFTPENSDTSSAHLRLTAGLTEAEKAAFRASMPPFEPAVTGCPSMGVLAECVRTTPGAVRSTHPQTSFAALGRRAAELLGEHDPHCHLGERSPLARLYEAGAQVLLFRVGFEVCSAFHLAEYRVPLSPGLRTYRCVVRSRGNWISYKDLVLDAGDFGAIGALLPSDLLAKARVAEKPSVLFDVRAAIDCAQTIMSEIRR